MKRLLVFSADAMVGEDLDYLQALPNYQKYLSGASIVKRVKSVYPTITYPCHTTMLTGVYPNKHGICGNFELMPDTAPLPWKWFYESVQWKDDLFTRAKKAGYTTASVFWPVTGNHPYIDYLVDEYWPLSKQDFPIDVYGRSGSKGDVLKIAVEQFEKHVSQENVRSHPELERFIVSCACEIIRRFQPHLLMLHPANIDAYRHQTGVFNDKVRIGIEETDQWIGDIMHTLDDVGLLEQTNFVLTSDHGQMEAKRIVNPNVILADHGLIRYNENNKLVDWDAWCLSGGFSALVYLKDKENKWIYDKTYALLKHMAKEGIYGINRVFTQEEANEQEHLGGDFSFVLESDGFSALGDHFVRPLVTNYDSTDYRYGRATHGYLPEKGPQPFFLAKGPDFHENIILENRNLVDEAPTFARLLGVALPLADGEAIEEFINP